MAVSPRTPDEQLEYDYSARLMDDHPLRSYPTGPEERCYAVKRGWAEKLFPVVCLSLMFFMVIQFLASLPYGVSYLLLRNEYDEQMGAVQWPREFHHSSAACLADNPLAHDNAVQYALDAGCTGAKADVWIESTQKSLVVGAVSGTSTLEDTYLWPLLDRNETVHPFTLVLELHAPLHSIWPRLVPLLTPLHSAGLLSYTDSNTSAIISRPVTILLAGKDLPASLAQMQKTNNPNSIASAIFLDTPASSDDLFPTELTPDPHPYPHTPGGTTTHDQTLTTTTNFTQSIGSPHRGRFLPQQIGRIRAQIRSAHAAGLRARYTGIPCRSVRLRRTIWRILVREGADLIEVEWAGCKGGGWRGFLTFGGVC